METFWSALIAAGGAIIVCLINNGIQNNATRKLLEYRLKELEQKMEQYNESHNTITERVFTLEKDVAIIKERLSAQKGDDGK